MKKIFLILLLVLSAATLLADNVNVVIETTMGDIWLELYPDVAPITVENFVDYVNDDFYDGLIFHRVIEDFMVQSGGYDPNGVKIEPTRDPIVNEFNLSNIRGTIAMAKLGGDPNSATTEFFISTVDNSSNLDFQNGGFTVFGRVAIGMDVVDAIAGVSVNVISDRPLNDIIINDIRIHDGPIIIPGDFNSDVMIDAQDLVVTANEWLFEGIIDRQWMTAEDETFSSNYGYAVAIYEDLAIVGAPGEDDAAGAAYILKREGIEWVQQARITPKEIGSPDDRFGFSVDIRDDFAVVSAPNEDTKGADAGKVYIFKPTDDPNEPWEQVGGIAVNDGHAGANLGYSISFDDNILAVGVPGDNENGTNSGAVYLFTIEIGDMKKLEKFSGEPGDMLGYSVAIDDGVVAAGAVYGGDPNSGEVHVFMKDPSSSEGLWYTEAVLSTFDGVADDWLGYSVDIDDGTILSGATGVDDNGIKSGAAYIFEYLPAGGEDPNSYWEETDKLTPDDPSAYDRFGCSVSIDGDFAIIGAKYDDDNGNNSGSAYLLKRDTAGDWAIDEKLTDDYGDASDYFGHAVAIGGTNALVGAYLVDGDSVNSGAVDMVHFAPDADLNGDNEVNLADFAIMAMNWLGG